MNKVKSNNMKNELDLLSNEFNKKLKILYNKYTENDIIDLVSDSEEEDSEEEDYDDSEDEDSEEDSEEEDYDDSEEEDYDDSEEEDYDDSEEEDYDDSEEEENSKIEYINLSKNKSGNCNYDEIFGIDLTYSKVISCIINNNKLRNLSYRGILIHVLQNMNRKTMLEQFSFNYSLKNMNSVGGYYWCKNLKISFQAKGAQHTLKEIIRLVYINNWSLKIKIKQFNTKIICYELN